MAQDFSVPSPRQTVKADMSPESPIAPYPPPDARAYASVLLRLQQGLAFAFLLV
ncbi:MAG: hypothetical protein RLZZ596_1548, partial [Pseudomonadota bacterium]